MEYQPLLYRVHKRKAGESVYRIVFYRTKGAHYVPVSNFHELMRNLAEQLERRKDEPAHFIAYTPALGFLAREKSEWDSLHDALIDNAKNMHLICPSEADIKFFHDGFMGRKTKRADKIDKQLIDSANQAC